MGRFERDEIEAKRLPTSLGSATEDLRSTIEAEVAKIVERAEARAAEIEGQALDRASRLQQDSERRAREVFQDSRERLQQMLAEIDAIDRVVSDAIRSLRAEAEHLTSEIESAREDPLRPTETIQPSDVIDGGAAPDGPQAEEEPIQQPEDRVQHEEPVQQHEAPVQQHEEPAQRHEEPVQLDEEEPEEQLGADEDELETGSANNAQADPEVREMIRQQLVSLAEGGRNRADAERMLLRFRQGEQYFDLLDEIYPEETAGRRGLLRRRKR
jgi:hypothetical protein